MCSTCDLYSGMIRGFSFINKDYDRVGKNWTLFFERSESNLHFLIHPYEIYSSEIDAPYIGKLVVTNSDLSTLWTSRVKHVLHLLEEGYDVIHSDLDAIWIKDPLPEITSLDSDIVFYCIGEDASTLISRSNSLAITSRHMIKRIAAF